MLPVVGAIALARPVALRAQAARGAVASGSDTVGTPRDSVRRDSTHRAILNPVVVTATREPTPLTAVTQPVVVLSGRTLRAQGVTTVAGALRQLPGAAVVQSGSYGAVTSLFLRGGESRYTKVLVDGVPVNAAGGALDLQSLSLDDVDRIEVVYGPSSALYGADAVAGVVQIFTRRAGRTPSADATIRGGTYGSHDATLALRSGEGSVSGAVGAGWHSTNGILPFNNAFSTGSVDGALDVVPDSATRIHITTRYNAATYHYPTDYTGALTDTSSYDVTHQLVGALDASRRISPWLTVRALAGVQGARRLTEDTQTDTTSGAAQFVKTSDPERDDRRFAEGRVEGAVQGLRLTAGARYERESSRTDSRVRTYTTDYNTGTVASTTGAEAHRITHGYYASVQGTAARRVAFDGGVRYDVHSDFRAATTGRGGVSVALWRGARTRASYGTAFNAPAFYESQGSVYNRPNPQLQPERAHTLDLALEQSVAGGRVVLTLDRFDQRYSQLIQYVPAIYDASFNVVTPAYYDNLTRARASGYEADVRIALTDYLTGAASYTSTRARVVQVPAGFVGGQAAGDALLRRASHTATASVEYAPRSWSAGIVAAYVGRRPDQDFSQFPSPTVTLPSHTRVDLSASADLVHDAAGTISATLRVTNLLDRRYEDVLHFPAPRRAVFVGLRLRTGA